MSLNRSSAIVRSFRDAAKLPESALESLLIANEATLDRLSDETLLNILRFLSPESLAKYCKSSVRMRMLCDDPTVEPTLMKGALDAERALRVKFFVASVLMLGETSHDVRLLRSSGPRDDGGDYVVGWDSEDFNLNSSSERLQLNREQFELFLHQRLSLDVVAVENAWEDAQDILLNRGYGMWTDPMFGVYYRLFRLWVDKVGMKRANQILDADIAEALAD